MSAFFTGVFLSWKNARQSPPADWSCEVDQQTAALVPDWRGYFFAFFASSAAQAQSHSGPLHVGQVLVSYCRRAVTALALTFSLNCTMSQSLDFNSASPALFAVPRARHG